MLPQTVLFDEQMVDIVCRTSPETAVERIFLLIDLRQRGFDESCGGTDQCDHPHPEHGSRAAGGDRGDHAHQIAHAHAAGG